MIVLACLRKGKTFTELAAGFGVGTTTAWRYAEEVAALGCGQPALADCSLRYWSRSANFWIFPDGVCG